MRTVSITFAAGDKFELEAGNFFQYLRGEDPIEVEFWRGSGRLANESTTLARPGYRAEPPRKVPRGMPTGEPVGFTRVVLTSATAQTVEIGISEGEGGYARFTGEVEVIGPLDGDGHIETADAKLLALLKNTADQRAPMTTLENALFANASNTTTTVVTSTANTNGIAIRLASVSGDGLSVGDGVLVDGNPLLACRSQTGAGGRTAVENIFVPAGKELSLTMSTTAGEANVVYEVL